MKQKFFLCLTFSLVALCAIGQPNYKQVYESIKTMKDYEAFQTLFKYQSETTSKDFVNVNGYYQMGMIAQKMIRQYDPFLQSQNAAQCISDAKTYLSLSLHYLTEKEVKANGKYYQGAGGGVPTYAAVKKDIEARIADVTEYNRYFTQNLEYLTRGIHRYNACIEAFGHINRQNSRLNDLYFLADPALKQNLADLQTNFDSTLYYIDKLKSSLEAYPMADYQISYSLAPVSVYRLHGLSAANFIEKEVTLWDFRTWVDAFNEMLNGDVAFLYKQADEAHKTNLDYIAKLKRAGKTPLADAAHYAVSPLVMNKIYKYDFNAVVAPLLTYQEEKIRFLYHNADKKIDRSLASLNPFASSNSYYYDLIAKKQRVDSALNLTVAKATPEAIRKYAAFFAANYKNFDGLKTYLTAEAKNNDALLRTALDAYKNTVWQSWVPEELSTVAYNSERLFTTVVTPNRTGKAGYFVHSKSVLPNKKVLVAGSYASPNSEVLAFVALLSEKSEVEWLKTFDKKEGKNHGVLTAVTDNGFAVVVTVEAEQGMTHSLYLTDGTGTVKKNVVLTATAVPRKLFYDDISQTFLLAFKGTSFMPFAISNDALQLIQLKADLSGSWSREWPFIGYLSTVIKINDRFYVYGAYNQLTDASGKKISAGDNRVNAFVYTLDETGKEVALKTFDATFSYYPLWVSKISNEYVDVIAVRGSADGYMDETNKSYYLILSSDNEVYYQY
jgi:hypothetical protein